MQRLHTIERQLTSSTSHKSDDDVVIVSAVRTPICRAKKGGLKDALPEDMLSSVLKAVIERARISQDKVQDIIVGNVLQPGAGATTARMAVFHAGFPAKVSVAAINRQCSSGLQAVASIASAIKAGYIDVGIGAGVESMTHYYGPQAIPTNLSKAVLEESSSAKKCLLPMGVTSENVAKKFGISRADQDDFSVESHRKAARAQENGNFKDEIVSTCGASEDDGIRGDSSIEQLGKLKPSFSQDGSTTAGNASQVSDGAAAVLLMRRSKAKELGVTILGRFLGFATVGCPPEIMGVGPVYAIPAVLQQTGLSINDIDVFELNEAFASQALYCIRTLKLPLDRVNPSGGAIALGHPLGATGARQIATILSELNRRRARYGVVSMCIGTGMGAAAVIEREQHQR